MSYGAAFGLSAAMDEEKEWRKNSGRIVSRSGGRRRRRGSGEGGGGGGKKESWDDQRARMRKEEAERRWRMGSGPKPDHVAEREYRDKTRSLDVRERESGLADADQARRLKATQEQRAATDHRTSSARASAGLAREVADLDDYMGLRDRRRELADRELESGLRAAQVTSEEQALKTLGRVGQLVAAGDMRGAARYISADPAFGIQGATGARVIDGPNGKVVEFVNDDGHVIPGDGGRPARFRVDALDNYRRMFTPQTDWKSAGGGKIFKPDTGDMKGGDISDAKARQNVHAAAVQLYRADKAGMGEARPIEEYAYEVSERMYPGRGLFPSPGGAAAAPPGEAPVDIGLAEAIRGAVPSVPASTQNRVSSQPTTGPASRPRVTAEEAADPSSPVYESARAALRRGVRPEVVAQHLMSIGGDPRLLEGI